MLAVKVTQLRQQQRITSTRGASVELWNNQGVHLSPGQQTKIVENETAAGNSRRWLFRPRSLHGVWSLFFSID
jgi:hypothetical protein